MLLRECGEYPHDIVSANETVAFVDTDSYSSLIGANCDDPASAHLKPYGRTRQCDRTHPVHGSGRWRLCRYGPAGCTSRSRILDRRIVLRRIVENTFQA
jgi:hypothetical protein